MKYNSNEVSEIFDKTALNEDADHLRQTFRIELPKEFIKKYIKKSDLVLDTGGGSGRLSIFMSNFCKKVYLLDWSSKMLKLASENINKANKQNQISIVKGDITNLSMFNADTFSFIVCFGDPLSFVLDKRFEATKELSRVAKKGAIFIIGVDSKFGFVRKCLAS